MVVISAPSYSNWTILEAIEVPMYSNHTILVAIALPTYSNQTFRVAIEEQLQQWELCSVAKAGSTCSNQTMTMATEDHVLLCFMFVATFCNVPLPLQNSLLPRFDALQIAPRPTTSAVAICSITTNQPLPFQLFSMVHSIATGVYLPTTKVVLW